jgi:hypothetical protein
MKRFHIFVTGQQLRLINSQHKHCQSRIRRPMYFWHPFCPELLTAKGIGSLLARSHAGNAAAKICTRANAPVIPHSETV